MLNYILFALFEIGKEVSGFIAVIELDERI
jgi:hypothetical protein